MSCKNGILTAYDYHLQHLRSRLKNRPDSRVVFHRLESIKSYLIKCNNKKCKKRDFCNECKNCSILEKVQEILEPLREEVARRPEEFYFLGENINAAKGKTLFHYVMSEVLRKSLILFLVFIVPEKSELKENLEIGKLSYDDADRVFQKIEIQKIENILRTFENVLFEPHDFVYLMKSLRNLANSLVIYNAFLELERKLGKKLKEKLEELSLRTEEVLREITLLEIKKILEDIEEIEKKIPRLCLSLRFSREGEVYFGPLWVLQKEEFKNCDKINVLMQLFCNPDPKNYFLVEIPLDKMLPLKNQDKEYILWRPTLLDDLYHIEENFFKLPKQACRVPYCVRCNGEWIEEYITTGVIKIEENIYNFEGNYYNLGGNYEIYGIH